ncbi:hypothetical protein BH10PLA2_BH10PLA2_27040 [soil metagenome]
MIPFTYPSEPIRRRHAPAGYAALSSYRPWLRDEFRFRCVYCLLREQWGRSKGNFELDHFLPVAREPHRSLEYDNLLYACATCNAIKQDQLLPDPCQSLVDGDVVVHADGTIEAHTNDAKRLVKKLALAEMPATEFRQLWIGIVNLAKQFDPDLYERLMKYPDDLPELPKLKPPQGNVRDDGISGCFFEKRRSGELPATY